MYRVSYPFKGVSKRLDVVVGVVRGVTEPPGSFITVGIVVLVNTIHPWTLSRRRVIHPRLTDSVYVVFPHLHLFRICFTPVTTLPDSSVQVRFIV